MAAQGTGLGTASFLEEEGFTGAGCGEGLRCVETRSWRGGGPAREVPAPRAAGRKRSRRPREQPGPGPESGRAGSGSGPPPCAAHRGSPLGGLGSAGRGWSEDRSPGSWTSPPDADAVAPTLPPRADGTPGRWLWRDWLSSAFSPGKQVCGSGQPHFVAEGRGTVIVLGTGAGPGAPRTIPGLGGTCPLPASASPGTVPDFLPRPAGR